MLHPFKGPCPLAVNTKSLGLSASTTGTAVITSRAKRHIFITYTHLFFISSSHITSHT